MPPHLNYLTILYICHLQNTILFSAELATLHGIVMVMFSMCHKICKLSHIFPCAGHANIYEQMTHVTAHVRTKVSYYCPTTRGHTSLPPSVSERAERDYVATFMASLILTRHASTRSRIQPREEGGLARLKRVVCGSLPLHRGGGERARMNTQNTGVKCKQPGFKWRG